MCNYTLSIKVHIKNIMYYLSLKLPPIFFSILILAKSRISDDLNQMNESRTSDLTVSVTSSNINDSNILDSKAHRESSCYYTDDDNDDDDDAFKETDTLLRKTTLQKMTLVDVDVDDESVALNV